MVLNTSKHIWFLLVCEKKKAKKGNLSKVVDTHRNFISVPGESFRLVSNEVWSLLIKAQW